MNGFGFIEYEDAMDARDVVPGKFLHGAHCLFCTNYLSAYRKMPSSHFSGAWRANPMRRWIGSQWVPLDRPIRTRLPPTP